MNDNGKAIRTFQLLQQELDKAGIDPTLSVQFMIGERFLGLANIFVEDEADNDNDFTFENKALDIAADILTKPQLKAIIEELKDHIIGIEQYKKENLL